MIAVQNTSKSQSPEMKPATINQSNVSKTGKDSFNRESAKINTRVVSQEHLNQIADEIEKVRNVRVRFSFHESSGKTLIKVTDKNTNEVIRQIPSEQILKFSANLDKMIGILFDEEV